MGSFLFSFIFCTLNGTQFFAKMHFDGEKSTASFVWETNFIKKKKDTKLKKSAYLLSFGSFCLNPIQILV